MYFKRDITKLTHKILTNFLTNVFFYVYEFRNKDKNCIFFAQEIIQLHDCYQWSLQIYARKTRIKLFSEIYVSVLISK